MSRRQRRNWNKPPARRDDQVAYWATPLPNDQFSFFTSTRLMKTSSHLDNDCVGRALNIEIGRVDDQIDPLAFGDDLEAVILRNFERRCHCVVDDVGDDAPIFGGLASRHVDTDQRHVISPL